MSGFFYWKNDIRIAISVVESTREMKETIRKSREKSGNLSKKKWWEMFSSAAAVASLTTLVTFLIFPSHITAYTFLHANGTRIVDINNQNIILKGLNLGGWNLQEGYILNPAGTSSVHTQWQMKLQYYNEGQSDDQVESFYQQWRDRFITKEDIDYIASLGFNTIRLPLHYELFLTKSQRSVRNSVIHNTDNYGNYLNSLKAWCDQNQIATDMNVDAYKIIDNILNWANSHQMYVILDMHAAPGGQGSDVAIADALWPNNLWENAWVYQDVLNRIWKQIAKRYKADGRIAFYDILNEPNNVPGGNPPIHDLLQVRTLFPIGNFFLDAYHNNPE